MAGFKNSLPVFLLLCVICKALELDVERNSCEKICSDTYSLHTYPKPEHLNSCLRGCRFFSIIDTIEEYNEINATRDSCKTSCRDAYEGQDESGDACVLGCNSSQPFFSPIEKYLMNELDAMFRPQPLDTGIFFPFLYVSDTYTNMIEKMNRQTRVSWSFYMQNDDGKLVVVKSEPVINYLANDEMTENYVENNIRAIDDSATPDLSEPAYIFAHRPLGENKEISMSGKGEESADWLSCVSRRTGLPRMLLTCAIFVSALGMIWLAITTTVTASEQRIHRKPKNISYYGDLDYLVQLEGKGLLTKVTPIGPEVQAPPLPVKLPVQQL